MTSSITAWSYSRLSLWEQCPLAFKLKHIDKVKEEQSPAMARGDRIHKQAAAWITGAPGAAIPVELAKFASLMVDLRDMPAESRFVEQQWGFNSNWRATGWFGKDTWLRVIADAGVVYADGTADVIDHKTGKQYETNRDQMRLNSLAVVRRFPHVSHVTNRLWYLDSGVEVIDEFDASDATEEIERWEARVAPMFADRVFAPRPNEKCRWCSYARSKGGQCKFG